MKDRTRKICSVLLTLTLFVGILLPMGAETVEAAEKTIYDPEKFDYEENGNGLPHFRKRATMMEPLKSQSILTIKK